MVALDIHGEVYAVARWVGVRSKDIVSRVGDIDALPSIEEQRNRVANLVRQKLSGFVDRLTEEFSAAAKVTEGKRCAMVESQQSPR